MPARTTKQKCLNSRKKIHKVSEVGGGRNSLGIQSKTKWAIIWAWSFMFFFLLESLLWFDAVVFPRRECYCRCMSGGRITITQNVSQTINNLSLQIYLFSVNTLSPSTDKRPSRQMLEFIILPFSISHFSKDGVQYLSCPMDTVGRGN